VNGARRLLLAGTALTALLALVAVASRAHRPGGGVGGGGAKVPPILLEYLGVFALFVIVVSGAIAVFAMADNRRRKALAGETHWARTATAIILVFGSVWLALFLTRHLHHSPIRPQGAVGPTGNVLSGPSGATARHTNAGPPASDKWLGVAVLGSVLLGLAIAIATAAAYRRTHAVEMDDEAALAAALDKVLADTLEDLYAERDPRRAVIGTYARMEETFAAYKVPRDEAETPFEYLARVLARLEVSSWAVRRLTLLFERAKFSAHEVDEGMKDEAIATLKALRTELEARDHEAVA
jgi:hypothetical protein